MNLCSEVLCSNRYDFECNCFFATLTKHHIPNIVPFSVFVLAVVTNRVETVRDHARRLRVAELQDVSDTLWTKARPAALRARVMCRFTSHGRS